MTSRTPHFVADALLVGAVIVLWRAVHDAAEGLQHMANVYADHQCPREVHVSVPAPLYPSGMFEAKPPASLLSTLVDPPAVDPAIARNRITLGGGHG